MTTINYFEEKTCICHFRTPAPSHCSVSELEKMKKKISKSSVHFISCRPQKSHIAFEIKQTREQWITLQTSLQKIYVKIADHKMSLCPHRSDPSSGAVCNAFFFIEILHFRRFFEQKRKKWQEQRKSEERYSNKDHLFMPRQKHRDLWK